LIRVLLNGSPWLVTIVNVATNDRVGDDAKMFGGIDNPGNEHSADQHHQLR